MSIYGGKLYGSTIYGGEDQVDVPQPVQDKRGDFQTVLDENGQNFALIRQEETSDGFGGVTSVTDKTIYVTGHLQPLSEKERELMSAGEIEKGNAKVYFKHEYTQDGTDYSPDTGDVLEDGLDRRWRIETIEGRYTILGFEIYRKAIVNRLDT